MRAPLLAELRRCTADAGLNLFGLVDAAAFDEWQPCEGRLQDRLPGCGTAVVLGCGGRGLWRRLVERAGPPGPPRRGASPVRDYARRCLREAQTMLVAADLDARLVTAADDGGLRFPRLAEAAGFGTVSPVINRLLHPDYGPWVSVFGALLLPGRPFGEIADASISATFQPCCACPRPCLAACPAGVHDGQGGTDLRACAEHRHADHCADSCSVRRACPIGAEHRYEPEEERHRHRQRTQAMERDFGLGPWRFVPRFLRRWRDSAGGVALALSASLSVPAQQPFATQVLGFDTRGGAGGGLFQPANALGAPQGGGLHGGAVHVHSLGMQGTLTLGLGVVLRDGPGADFLVAENAFQAGAFGQVFAEVCFVEVSSNGVDFARLPARYAGPGVAPGPFGTIDVGSYENLAGAVPVLAGSGHPGADPFDVVMAGGDAFDLADLAVDPLVRNGRVDLQAITQVRLVDALGGVDRDASGAVIHDAGTGSADIDAVTVLHHGGNAAPSGPMVALRIDPDGRFTLDLDDPDGWQDLDPLTLHASLQGLPVDAGALLSVCQVLRADRTGFTLRYPVPLPVNLRYRLACSVRDRAGHRSGAARIRPR